MKRLFVKCLSMICLAAIMITVAGLIPAFAQDEKTLKTKYTNIHFTNGADLVDFMWHIGGSRPDLSRDRTLASNFVDRIIERVQAILDMRPKDLSIDVYLQRGELKENEAAFYQHKTKAIYVSVDRVTDGIFAHEAAHAIVNQYFTTPTPSKIQEIISQYVDRYLWSDY